MGDSKDHRIDAQGTELVFLAQLSSGTSTRAQFLLCTTGIFPFVLKHPRDPPMERLGSSQGKTSLRCSSPINEGSNLELVPCKSAGNFMFSVWRAGPLPESAGAVL